MQTARGRRSMLMAALVAFLGVAVVSFVVGRITAPDASANGVSIECAPEPLTQAALPEGFAETSSAGYFSLCEKQAAAQVNGFGEPFPPIKMYGDPEGTVVIGMWYGDCGYPEGLVHPDEGRPACVDGGTTAP